ncbi:hypothetical protein CAOG_09018 [Capsaspora owczarzaki ATCC 30864]|uniref:hypothetical protein n=1 Tax=Capsaspora owczarzaki (strain ATCC 30864) TaxID=595528 RepID=UPI000352560A|nr:hypothetical protein CAOG_09018 [Capsaspora owczarzaki ATCC 30864]|eukprot:XP_011270705.1 hypothetical protein CAOG_09018 [Capsaspora owczarzaki ATCC 30864]
MRPQGKTAENKQLQLVHRRQAVLNLRAQKVPVKQIATQTGLSLRGIYHIIDRYPDGIAAADARRPGRPNVLTDRDSRQLRHLVSSTPAISAKTAASILPARNGRHPGTSTIKRALHEMEFVNTLRALKPRLNKKNAAERLAWCTDHRSFTVADWRKVVFSSEAHMRLHASTPRGRVWRKKGAPLTRDMVKETVQHGGTEIYLWGAISSRGPLPLVPLDEALTGKQYAQMLDKNLLPGMNRLKMGGTFIFMQDNAAVHTSKPAIDYLEDADIKVLNWPPYSPDLNPIENLWAEIQKGVLSEFHPQNKQQLWEAIEKWTEKHVTPQYCRALIDSMPKRIEECLSAKGWYTKY